MKQTWILRTIYWAFILALSIAFASAAVRYGGPIAAGMTIAAGLFVGYVVFLRVRLQEEADAEDRS